MMKPSLQLRIGQQLTMTPQLQQAIRLLQLPTIELQAQIREALESNVMLEVEDDGEEGLSLEELATSSDERAADPADQAAEEPTVETWIGSCMRIVNSSERECWSTTTH